MQELVVIILTLDEEPNLEAALASVGTKAPVLVLDSGSSDRTQELAREGGAELHVRKFDDYATQRNHALDLVRDRFRWVLFLDADERMTPELWAEIEQVLPRDDVDGVYIGWVFEVLGRDLHHGSFGIASNLRLMRAEKARFGRATHERVDDREMRVIRLRHKIRHADAKPLAEWFRKHIRYAQWEAKHYVDGTDEARGLEGFSLRTKAGRTVGLRWAYNKLPLFVRPFLHLGRTVVLHGAWRDGVPGLMYAGMQSLWYPMMTDLFILEEKRRRRRRRRDED
ncbi:glycosyltransferase family 2 protein [Paraliomyxa miuraensis]|uniref:glycosyltransferase family 2 protein n=1 Tax=Paraliomyxa miuraensis TaxID=376150 RepID=UPI00225A4CDD|nr:glycosyltransferase family 2 protein [Paraliomyxa miuraensis]MCX4247884.1 glycosyltransferase family 2 protein [Paraliomyxa miuraensis]